MVTNTNIDKYVEWWSRTRGSSVICHGGANLTKKIKNGEEMDRRFEKKGLVRAFNFYIKAVLWWWNFDNSGKGAAVVPEMTKV